MEEKKRKGEVEIDLSAIDGVSSIDVFDGTDGSTRSHKDKDVDRDRKTYGSIIDAFYVNSGEHISVKKLEAIYGAIADATNNGVITGDGAQKILNESEKYKSAVEDLIPTESTQKEIIGAMAHKEVDGKTRIDAFTLNAEIRDGDPMQNPITITIKLKSGKALFWDMPQHKLYEKGADGGRKEIENVKEAEEMYKISLPRTNECILAPNQQRLDKDSKSVGASSLPESEDDDLELSGSNPLLRTTRFDLGRREVGKSSSKKSTSTISI